MKYERPTRTTMHTRVMGVPEFGGALGLPLAWLCRELTASLRAHWSFGVDYRRVRFAINMNSVISPFCVSWSLRSQVCHCCRKAQSTMISRSSQNSPSLVVVQRARRKATAHGSFSRAPPYYHFLVPFLPFTCSTQTLSTSITMRHCTQFIYAASRCRPDCPFTSQLAATPAKYSLWICDGLHKNVHNRPTSNSTLCGDQTVSLITSCSSRPIAGYIVATA